MKEEIDKILMRIEKKWQKRSDRNDEDGGEGYVSFDDCLRDVKCEIERLLNLNQRIKE